MTDYQDLLYEKFGPVVRVSHNRPARGNAQSFGLLRELDDAIARVAADPDVSVMILASVGKHFSAGHDLKEWADVGISPSVEERWALEGDLYYGVALRLWELEKPTIAQVQGACIAAGFMTANMCDLIVAADDAFFSDPVTKSLGAASVEMLVHPWVLTSRKAREMLYTSEPIPARDALEFGMVNRVVPRADLESETMALAEKIATTPAFALQLVKRSLNRTQELQGFRHAVKAHFDTHQLSHYTETHKRTAAQGMGNAISVARAGSRPDE
jgi:enoyl-CoA hydratase